MQVGCACAFTGDRSLPCVGLLVYTQAVYQRVRQQDQQQQLPPPSDVDDLGPDDQDGDVDQVAGRADVCTHSS